MHTRLHPMAATLGLLTILSFWTATIISELTGSPAAISGVKLAIPWGLPILILALAVTAITGRHLAGHSPTRLIQAKQRRMPIIAANGLLVLVPSAIILAILAGRGQLGVAFYCVQALELVAGAINLTLMSLNARDGLSLTGRIKLRNWPLPAPAGQHTPHGGSAERRHRCAAARAGIHDVRIGRCRGRMLPGRNRYG